MQQFELVWHGHACFSLTCREFTVVFDPYKDNHVPGFGPLDLEADLVLCSHQHDDHNAAQLVRLRNGRENPFHITTLETFHDPEGGALRGMNTIHILESGGLRLAHFGDLGCALTPQQQEALFLSGGYLAFLLSFAAFSIKYPYTCSSDFRYIVVCLIYIAIGLSDSGRLYPENSRAAALSRITRTAWVTWASPPWQTCRNSWTWWGTIPTIPTTPSP